MLALAVERGADLTYVKELMALYKEWLADKAKQEFDQAFSDFQGECPEIRKTGKASFEWKNGEGVTEYSYDELGVILKAIAKPMARYKLSKDWLVKEVGPNIEVTCVITHAGGHSKAGATLSCPPDTSGQKNLIQAKSSTITYLQRITLKAALGLAAVGEDDDGAGSAKVSKPYDMDILPIPGDEEFNAFLKALERGTTSYENGKAIYAFTDEQHRAIEIVLNRKSE